MDLAIRIGHLADSSLIARKLFDVRAVVCASPHYLATHGTPQTPDDLLDHDCLVYSNLVEPDVVGMARRRRQAAFDQDPPGHARQQR